MPPNLLWDLLADIRQKTGNRARPMTHRLALLLLRQWVQQEPYLINRRRPATKDGAAGAMKVPVGQRLLW